MAAPAPDVFALTPALTVEGPLNYNKPDHAKI
jgi:hypothetical protein